MRKKVRLREMLCDPRLLLAYGFGFGLAPKAPGTFGTLVGIPLVVLIMHLPSLWAVAILSLLFAVGVPICRRGSEHLETDDPGAVVWDEIVGYGVAVVAIPFSLWAMVIAFMLFRMFDILKPWPIKWADSKVHGGLGIMLDDLLAGLLALGILHLIHLFL